MKQRLLRRNCGPVSVEGEANVVVVNVRTRVEVVVLCRNVVRVSLVLG